MDTEGAVAKQKFAKVLAQPDKPVEAVTPVKWIGDDKPKFLDRYEEDIFYKRSAKREPETPVTPTTPASLDASTIDKSPKIEEGLVPIAPTISILSAHLVFGGCRQTPYSKTARTSVVCTALLGEMALFGTAILLFEGTDVFSSYNSSDPQPDYNITRESILAGVSVLIQLIISTLMVFLYSRHPKAASCTNTLLVFAYLGGIVGLSVFYTKYWSLVWMVGFGVAFIIEILIAQTILMVFIYTIHR